MKLEYLIPSLTDRIFIIEPECYLIFTGESLNDQKPFIQIGLAKNLPPEVISLIENIIIPDDLTGDLDAKISNPKEIHLKGIEYIGNKETLNNFLNYQKFFNLDQPITNIHSPSEELPPLALNQNISAKNHFIGIFCKDHNFKILYNKTELLNLNKLKEKILDYNAWHQKISLSHQDHTLYQNQGLIIYQGEPIFYSQNEFIFSTFPSQYFEFFSRAKINPQNIKAAIFPNPNKMNNIAKFLKWKNNTKGSFKIFTDHFAASKILKKLFPQVNLTLANFSKLTLSLGQIEIKNYLKPANLGIIFKNLDNPQLDLKIIYLKEEIKITEVNQNELDGLIINYQTYEKMNLLLKSIGVTTLIIDDGYSNLKKIIDPNLIVLSPQIPCEFEKAPNKDYLITTFTNIHRLLFLSLEKKDLDEINKIILMVQSESNELIKNKNLFNLLAPINFFILTSLDKNYSLELKKNLSTIKKEINYSLLEKNYFQLKKNIIFFEKNAFEIISLLPQQGLSNIFYDNFPWETKEEKEIFDLFPQINGEQLKFFNKINNDRSRLKKIIKWREKPLEETQPEKNFSYSLPKPPAKSSSDFSDFLLKESPPAIKIKPPISPNPNYEKSKNSSISSLDYKNKKTPPKNKNIFALSLIVTFIILLSLSLSFFLSNLGLNPFKTKLSDRQQSEISTPTNIITSSDISKSSPSLAPESLSPPESKKEPLAPLKLSKSKKTKPPRIIDQAQPIDPEQSSSLAPAKEPDDKNSSLTPLETVNDRQIYDYANKVALKNGYNRLSKTDLKDKKNPHWIYPGNIIIMLDEEQIKVKAGDNIWKLCEKKIKLIKKTKSKVKFY